MSNSFDFEITANDQASQAVARIDEAVRKLDPMLQQTRNGLQLGGQETVDGLDGLSNRLTVMSRAARDNVQFIGDMVPPLKMVGELATKYGGMAGRLGLLGAGAYAIGKGGMAAADALKQASQNAYGLDVASKNAGMRVDEFTRLSGAMQILGSDSDTANQSVQGLYHTFNEALQGRNSGVLALLAQMGVQITKNKDGTADVMRTMESLARIVPTLAPEKQKTVADALGLDENGLKLLREGVRLKELLGKADKFGLTVDPQVNKQLSDLNTTINELGAAWDGLKNRTKQKAFGALLSDGSIKDGLEGIQDLFTNGLDSISLSHALGATRGKEADQLRWGYNNPEFYKQLGTWDKVGLDFGIMTDGFRQKYDAWEKPQSAANQLINDISVITGPQAVSMSPYGTTVPYDQPWNNALGLRNNNPGNLRSAPNATGFNAGFATFQKPEDGLSAMARQLMLYGDRGNNTLEGILQKYAPRSENDTTSYINAVSTSTGYDSKQQLNLHDPDTLQTVMSAMIRHEQGTQPFSAETISSSINSAINEERWGGLRDESILTQQRENTFNQDDIDRRAGISDSGRTAINKEQWGGLQDESILSRQREKMFSQTSIDGRGEISDAFRTALEDNPLKLEITVVNEQTGNRQKTHTNSGGRITVPMQSP